MADLVSMAEKRKLGEMLLEAGLIDEFQLNTALSDQKQWGRPLGVTLVRLDFVAEADLMRALSEQLGLPIVALDDKCVAPEVLELVPHEIASKHRCLPLAVQHAGSIKELYLGMSDPTDLQVVDDIGFRTGHKICPVLVGDQQLEEAIDRSYRAVDVHNRLVRITPEDIMEPGTATRAPRRPADRKQPEPREPVSLAPSDEPELVLTTHVEEPKASFTDGMQTLADVISAQSPESQGTILKALVQLLISRGLIDLDELISTIESIAADRP